VTALEVLRAARAAGLHLELEGPDIAITPATKLTPELRRALKAAKPALVDLLGRACRGCGSVTWRLSVVDDRGHRTCSDCLSGRRQLRDRGVPMGAPF
jgi:hypothetical protein